MSTSARPETPIDGSAARLDRRQLMKAGAWAAPALLVAVAAPAAVASAHGDIPLGKLTLSISGISDLNSTSRGGPLQWNGGQIQYSGNWTDSVGTVGYSIVATGPNRFSKTLATGSQSLAVYGNVQWYQDSFPGGTAAWNAFSIFTADPTPPGTYTVTLTAFGRGASAKSVSTSITL